MGENELDTAAGGGGEFLNTSWTLVAGLQNSSPEARKEALGHLYEKYRKPVYHYIRHRWSKSPHDAWDLTQYFFLEILEGDPLKRYEPGRASFRTYLKRILRNVAGDRLDYARAKKRGGGVKVISIPEDLEDSLPDERSKDPEQVLDWAWRMTVLSRVMDRVQQQFASEGREAYFRTFKEAVHDDPDDRTTKAEVAERLGISEHIVGNHLFAVRERLRSEIRAELTHTVLDRDQLEEEYRLIIGESGI
jgi:RNA polymerase sigma factor (sigma-70 family)